MSSFGGIVNLCWVKLLRVVLGTEAEEPEPFREHQFLGTNVRGYIFQ